MELSLKNVLVLDLKKTFTMKVQCITILPALNIDRNFKKHQID